MNIPEWQSNILKHGELYRVGGVVRDELLGVGAGIQDTDLLVRGIPPEKLETSLKRFGKIVFVGKSFGVYKFTPSGSTEVYDIAFPRTERSVGVGHRDFEVKWDWRLAVEDDLRRRDFTINAIAQNVRDGRLVDPLGGKKDIERRKLRMIFPETFLEDPLRILRGIRFQTRFNLDADEDTREAMEAGVGLLKSLSAERVQEEFTKLLTQCERPSEAFQLMHGIGALAVVLPELAKCAGVSQNEYHPDDVFVHSIKACDHAPKDNLAVRWAALLHDLGKVDKKQVVEDQKLGERVVFYGHQGVSAQAALKILRRLRYRNALVKKCELLIEHHMFNYEPDWKDATVRRFIRKVGESNLEELFLLRQADVRSRGAAASLDNLRNIRARVDQELLAGRAMTITKLGVDGKDVMRLTGVEAGPEVGKILNELLELVLDDPGKNDRNQLLELLKNRKA